MKQVMMALLLAGSFVALSAMEASAVVCARGVHRAGCVGAHGAVVVGTRQSVPLLLRRGGRLFAAGCTDPIEHTA